MSCHCERNEASDVVIDSGVYLGVIYARDYLVTRMGSGYAYSNLEKMWKTGVFAAASLAWDNLLPEWLYDSFMQAGEKISNDYACAYCQARNLYIVFIQFLVSWFRHGRGNASQMFWEGLDEYIRLMVTDYTSTNWVRGMLADTRSMSRGVRSVNTQRLPGDVHGGVGVMNMGDPFY